MVSLMKTCTGDPCLQSCGREPDTDDLTAIKPNIPAFRENELYLGDAVDGDAVSVTYEIYIGISPGILNKGK